jgi:hypothetical protein
MSTIIKRDTIQVLGDPSVPVATASRARTDSGAAQVRLISVAGEARLVEVVCTCGREHAIELRYEEPATPAPSRKETR